MYNCKYNDCLKGGHLKMNNKNKFRFISIFIFAVVFTVLNFTVAFATDKNVTILSPLSQSTVEEGNILLSVKITEPKNIKIDVSEIRKQEEDKDVLSDLSVIQPATFDLENKEMLEHFQEVKKKTKALEEADMKNILEKKYQDMDKLIYLPVVKEESFASNNKLSFYTKKLENYKAGVYMIEVKTVGKNGEIVNITKSFVSVVPKKEEKVLFQQSQKGTPIFLQTLIKAIFGN